MGRWLTARRAALIVFLASLALTLLVAGAQWHFNLQTTSVAFSELVAGAVGDVSRRMALYEYGVRGARGAVITAGPEHITRASFRRYALSRETRQEFPGARGFGFIRRVAEDDEHAFVADARSDGMPDFSIRQLEPHAGERFVIQYIEPAESNRAAIGLDIASEKLRRTAALRAAQENAAIITAPITLVQAIGKPKQSFLLLLPIYSEQASLDNSASREAAAIGWAYAPLLTEEVLSGLTSTTDYVMALRDLGDDAPGHGAEPFFATGALRDSTGDALTRRVPLNVYGRTWEAQVQATPAFVAGLRLRSPWLVAAEGAVIGAVLTALAWFYGQSVARSTQLVAEQARRAAMIESATDAIIGVSSDGRILSWNRAAETIFGYPHDEAIGKPIDLLLPPDALSQGQPSTMDRVLRGEVVPPYDTVRRTRSGIDIDVSISIAPVRDEAGRIVGLAKTIRNISERRAAERELQKLTAELEQKVTERTAGLEAARRDLRTILDAVPSMIGYWDKNLRNRFANRAYQSWFGVEPDSLMGRSMTDLLGEELFERNRPFVEGALRGEPQTFERAIPTPDGKSIRHSLAHYLPDILDGKVQGFYVLVHDLTELKESRQRAATVQRDNDFLLGTIRQYAIVSIADADGRIIDVNDAFCAISGYSLPELIGRTHALLDMQLMGADSWRMVNEDLAAGKAWRGELCNRAKDGSLYWVDSIIAPSVDADGKVERYISISFDISERMAATAQLNAAHERLALATDAAGIGVWEYDLTSNVLRWDDGMYRLYGQTRSANQEPYSLWAANVHPDDIAPSEQALADCIAGRRDFNVEFRVKRPDQQTRHIRAAAKTFRDGDGKAIRMVGINWDITERKQAEIELAQATSLIRAVLGSATEVSIVATDADFLIHVFNRGAERMLGYAGADVIGVGTPGLFHDDEELKQRSRELSESLGHPVRARDYFRQVEVHGQPMEWTYVRKDGSRLPVSLVVTAMCNDSGEPMGYLGIAYDISAQKEHERALREAKQDAERANHAKSEFLANMSHEIRTPMNAVIGLGYLLAKSQLDPQQSALLEKMSRASHSLLGIINDVLDLSKIESGELSMSIEPFHLRDLVNSLVDVMRLQSESKGVSLNLIVGSDVPSVVVGDSLRVNQILTNLLSNAIKFTAKGSVGLSVGATPSNADEVLLRFEVRDTGIGISEADAAKLFQPFAQADGSITRRFGGTGLGLSIVKHLAERLGGRIGLESEPGVGSLFWVELPATRSDQPIADALPSPTEAPTGRTLAGVHVLVVDDSDINREVAKHILELEGARVSLAANGREAVDWLQGPKHGCDIVLMDVHMPVMDGLTATRTLRKDLGLVDLPVLALTAGALASQREETELAGMNDFIIKPFEPHAVIERMLRHLPHRVTPADAKPAARRAEGAWPSITGIAATEVRARLDGDLPLFKSLLKYLLSEFRVVEAPQTVADALAVAGRLHKLRGCAGNIGAVAAHDAATSAEEACRSGNLDFARERIGVLNERLSELSGSADAWLAAEGVPDLASDHSASTVGDEEIQSLLELLNQQHVSAIDQFEAMAAGLRSTLGGARFERLQYHVERLQFAEAAKELTQLPSG